MKRSVIGGAGLLVALGVSLLALPGCGADVAASCMEYCDAANKCEGVELDCNKQCDEPVRVAERIGCEGETVDFYECASSQDICNGSELLDACESEFSAVLSCTLEYCADNPADEVCGVSEG